MKNYFYSLPLRLISCFALCNCLAGVASAQAQSLPGESWQFELTPYLWASRMDGRVQAGSLPSTNVDMKFSDILENLDMGFMSAFEARKGRLGLLFDGMYMKVSDSASASREAINLTVNANVRIKQTMLAGAVAYRVLEGAVPLDLIGGLRYNRIDVDAEVDAALYGGAGSLERSGQRSWVDPYVGLRANIPIIDKLQGLAYIDFGGFQIGSDFTWQGMFGVNYAYSKSIAMTAGYRYMDVNYDKNGFLYKMANDGIYTGVSFRF